MVGSKCSPEPILDDLQRFPCLPRLLIRAIGGHGVERVGDGDDARAKRDLLALATVVAVAVELLVVEENDRHRVAQHAAHRLDDVGAVLRVLLELLPLVTDTEVKNVESSVVNRFRITTLERGLPNTRWSFNVNHDAGRWNLMGRLNYFGQFWDSEDGRNAADLGVVSESWLYPSYSGKALLDVQLGIPFRENVTLAIGGENVLNTYPDVNQNGILTVGNYYSQFSPFGFNGANFYVRLNYSWGMSRPGGAQRSS